MVMAAQLANFGVSVRIIDRLDKPVNTSRAFTLHARTLELLGQMGLSKKYLENSIRTYSMDYHFPKYENTPKLNFRDLDSTYPFALTIDQTTTERILREHLTTLGINIEWNKELRSFTNNEDSTTAILLNTDTQEEEIVETEWLIGCDGYSSSVRKNLNITLDGSDYGGTMRMMDVAMSGFKKSNEAIHYFIAKDHMLLINKLPGKNYRLLISDKTEGVPPEQARKAFQSVLDKHFLGQVIIEEPSWSTNFRISKRKVNAYRHGSIFLAGDAAHINSPAGGQGMNVAIQDAFNLGWKLGMFIKGIAKKCFLDSYEKERSPVANQMLEGTNYIHSIIMAHGQGMQERIERMKNGAWNKQAVNQIAGISYTYRNLEETKDILATGDRAPDGFYDIENRIYDLMHYKNYALFLFAGQNMTPENLEHLDQLAQSIKNHSALTIVPYIISASQIKDHLKTRVIVDDGRFHKQYRNDINATNSKMYLIRPDCYIAFYSTHIDGIKEYLDTYFYSSSLLS